MARKDKRQERREARARKQMFLNDAVLRQHEPKNIEPTKEDKLNQAACLILSNSKGQRAAK